MLPSSEQWNTYKHLYFSERDGLQESFKPLFSEWSYGIEVLGRNSAEDRGLRGHLSTELKVLHEH